MISRNLELTELETNLSINWINMLKSKLEA